MLSQISLDMTVTDTLVSLLCAWFVVEGPH
jgi:hypothetical protein